MDTYFAYVRVSTPRQGHFGVSLGEQRDAILQFAERRGLTITRWFEEIATSSKRGRACFQDMMRQLAKGDAQGLIVHKIDRSARNLRDWADLGELIDQGVDVRFAHDDLSLASRGGRLAADIQAVIAADYVRNLREEVRKGFYGRLKQGLYPLPAPLGYVDRGAGRMKVPHPRLGSIVTEAFRLYASGDHSIRELQQVLYDRGLVNRRFKKLSFESVRQILRNPFYAGTIHIWSTGQQFPGIHEPLVSLGLFEQVQIRLKERKMPRRYVRYHAFTYSHLLRCGCGRYRIGERQKGHVYYRCHRCKGPSLREEKVDAAAQHLLNTYGRDSHMFLEGGPHEKQTSIREIALALVYADGEFSFDLRREFELDTTSTQLSENFQMHEALTGLS